jgi:alkylation response protein AidB-like acyl-CoA dehydrogenase
MTARHPAAEEQGRSREVAEASREQQWRGDSFLRELFLGRYRLDLFDSLALAAPERPAFRAFHDAVREFLASEVDPVEIDARGEYPESVVRGLARLGAFGMKIPEQYGGLGLTHAEYMKVMALIGSYDGNLTALLSAHQSIGVPQPIHLFGTEEQKRRYLPRCARGAISAFALTEPAVGSDPASLGTTAEPSEDGEHFILDGQKLWCTNGTIAELVVVMARNPRTNGINAFVVEMSWEGVSVEHRCHFMGLRALANALISFDHVRVPRANLIGEEGAGLKIALVTLNTGRLSLPAATAGIAKRCTEIVRKWSNARVQWGLPIGKHEAVAHMNADIVCSAFAMESVALAVGELADRRDVDLRLEAAAAKEWNTVRAWRVIDETLQVRGGRGYETERSLAQRGEAAIGVERMLRDLRVNLIFEGSSEIMHLFIAREAVDKHLNVAGALVDPFTTRAQRLRALPRIIGFYALWYPSRWLGFGFWPRFRRRGPLAAHHRFAERASRRLARAIFHGMLVYRAGLERRQAFLFRAVDIAIELFAMAATSRHAEALVQSGVEHASNALALADLHARHTRRHVRSLFRALFRNDDARSHALGIELLRGRHRWIEQGAMPIGYEEEELTPKTVEELRRERALQPRREQIRTRHSASP